MNFLRALPCLALLALCGALNAQMTPLKPEGGGNLKIGDTLYRFELTGLSSAAPKGGLSGALKLEGKLVPQDPAQSFRMALTVLKDGSLYSLAIQRKRSGAYPDTWAATQKTRIHAIKLEDHPGGRVEIRCEGRLTGILQQQPQDATWSGTLWAVFPEPEEEDFDQD